MLALGGVGVAAFLVLTQPHGERYAFLFVAPVIYVSFFFKARNAIINLAVVSMLGGIALALALPSGVRRDLGARRRSARTGGGHDDRPAPTSAPRLRTLAAHRAVLDAFFLNAPGGFAFLDGDLRYVRVNPMLAALMGSTSDEIVGRSVRELTPDYADRVEPLLRSVIDDGNADHRHRDAERRRQQPLPRQLLPRRRCRRRSPESASRSRTSRT